MAEFDRLKRMVSLLREKERRPGDGRQLSGGDASQRLAALVAEVNETILPRRLIFQWDDGPGVQLAVANRRLQGVLAPSVEGLMPHAGKPLSAPEDEITDAVKTALLGALETATSAKIKSRHLGSDDLGSDAGISADALAKHWGISSAAAVGDASSDALPSFLDGLGGLATAWLSVEGEDVAAQGGPEADVAQLGETAAYLLDAYLNRKEELFGSDEKAKCFAVSGAETGVFFGDTGAQTVFALAPAKDVIGIVSLWRTSFG